MKWEIYFVLIFSLKTVNMTLQLRNTVPSSRPEKNDLHSHRVINASNSLCLNLLKNLPPGENALISPLSISLSMAMIYMGARNRTALELSRVLRYEKYGLHDQNIHQDFKNVINVLKQTGGDRGRGDEQYNLEIASAILVDDGYKIVPTFKGKCRQFYDAAVESMNFSANPNVAMESINGWTAYMTRNKIRQVLQEPPDPLTRLFLLNAIYFKGTWKVRFDQRLTMPDTFYNEGKVPTTVPMMRQKSKFNYGLIMQLKSAALELPYDGDYIKMLILLPEKRDGLQYLESSLTEDILDAVSQKLRMVTVQVTLPRFSLSEEYDMLHIFKRMGITSVFDSASADLSGISSENNLYVTKIVHKSIIDVNEEGSEAAAIAAVAAGLRTGGPPFPFFTADHPFMFFIRDIRTNAILFVGRINVL